MSISASIGGSKLDGGAVSVWDESYAFLRLHLPAADQLANARPITILRALGRERGILPAAAPETI